MTQVELKTGETYRGQLVESEDNWNCQMTDVTHVGRDGKESKMEHVYIRGSKVRMMVIPDMLKHAPMFKRSIRSLIRRAGRSRRCGGVCF